jgi:hypothetical protein
MSAVKTAGDLWKVPEENANTRKRVGGDVNVSIDFIEQKKQWRSHHDEKQ